MKKLMAILAAMLLICGMSVVASADITAPEGYTVTPLFDFTALPDGTSTATELGFWTADANAGGAEVVVEGGKITFSMPGNWGAFPNLNEDQQALTKTATGWGFYVAGGELGGTICAGFNATNGTNTILKEDQAVMFVALDGTVTTDVTYGTSFNQGGFYVPEGFEGYVYIPFSAYVANDGTGVDHDPANGVATPIYAMDTDIDTITYGEFFVFSSDLVIEGPTPEPTPESTPEPTPEAPETSTEAPSAGDPTDTPSEPATPAPANNGWIIWVAVAAAVVVVVVVVIIISKKKK